MGTNMSAASQPPGVFLRSTRFLLPSDKAALSHRLQVKLVAILKELNVPERPLPTQRITIQYDFLRQDILKVLALQQTVWEKEGTAHDLREKRLFMEDPTHVIMPRPTGVIKVPDPVSVVKATAAVPIVGFSIL